MIHNPFPRVITSICIILIGAFSSTALGNVGSYFTLHHDIKVAIEEADYKKAKTLVETLIPLLDSDIVYTREALSEGQDEYILKDLNAKLERQLEIREMLGDFLSKGKKGMKEFESLDVIRELRRLSIKPKNR